MKSRRYIILIAAIVAIVILVVAGAVYFENNSSSPESDGSSSQTYSSTADDQTTGESDTNGGEDAAMTQTKPLTIYYVAVGYEGEGSDNFGCGDSLVSTTTEDVTFDDQVKATMEHLLANDNKDIGQSGLYNSLYQSDLSFDHANLNGDVLEVYLIGDVRSGGTCDDPRIHAQLEAAAKTASGAKDVVVYVNNRNLDKVLGL